MFSKRTHPLTYASVSISEPRTLPFQHAQTQSPFFSRLPAELRNNIYLHVFTHEDSSVRLLDPSGSLPHPLSVLLTCRRTYHEAGILAFNTYTFPIGSGTHLTYLGLKTAVSHLSTVQVDAVRSFSVLSIIDAGSLLSNALLIFPRLHRFVIKIENETRMERHRPSSLEWQLQGLSILEWHQSPHPISSSADWSEHTDLYLQAVDRYAPHWFVHIIQCVTNGRAYAWQSGSKWTAQWPQLESALCYSRIQYDTDGLREELYMDADAVGIVPGVQMCICGCEDVSWTYVVLVQEGGRHINVDIMFCNEVEPPEPETEYVPNVVLVPGTTPASDAVIKVAGMMYEADEKYWEAIRRRNGNLAALCRGLWRKAVRPVAAGAAEDENMLRV